MNNNNFLYKYIMLSSKTKIKSEINEWQTKLFSVSLRRKNKLKKIKSYLNNVSDLKILEISSGDAVLSQKLMENHNNWTTVSINEKSSKSLNYYLKNKTEIINNNKIPFSDGEFDLLIIIDCLKNVLDDYEFIQECHRVINNNGWVIISERKKYPGSLVALLQHIFKTKPVSTGAIRNGYTSDQLYRILKDGFDVPEINSYSNALLETLAVFNDLIQRSFFKIPVWIISNYNKKEDLYRYRNLYNLSKLTYPLMWIFSKFNFLPNHEMILKSRRRRWSPRRQPKLVDGRSIAEATINTRIGTAAPF